MGVEAVEALAAVKEMAEEEDAIEPAANELATDERAIAELTAVEPTTVEPSVFLPRPTASSIEFNQPSLPNVSTSVCISLSSVLTSAIASSSCLRVILRSGAAPKGQGWK